MASSGKFRNSFQNSRIELIVSSGRAKCPHNENIELKQSLKLIFEANITRKQCTYAVKSDWWYNQFSEIFMIYHE